MSDHDWFDTLPAEAQEEVRSHEAIVRDLAARGPLADGDSIQCVFCFEFRASYDDDSPFLNPETHHPTCLWRRACALYPKA